MKKRTDILFLVVVLAFSSGCFWKKNADAPVVEKVDYRYANTGQMLDRSLLAKGGSILVVPFTAGAGVLANDELDRIALHIVKGIADVIGETGSSFQVLMAENTQATDFVVKGHITEIGRPGKLRRWTLTGNTISLGVQARMIEQKNSGIVALFSYRENGRRRAKTFEELGYEIGRKIGMFIADAGS